MASSQWSDARRADSTGFFRDHHVEAVERRRREQTGMAVRRSRRLELDALFEEDKDMNEEVLADIQCDPRFWMSEVNRIPSQTPGPFSIPALTQETPTNAMEAMASDPYDLPHIFDEDDQEEGEEEEGESRRRTEAILKKAVHPAHQTGLADMALLTRAAQGIQEDGFTPLIGSLLAIEKRAGHHLSEDLKINSLPYKEIALQVLCSMYEETIPLLISGNLFETYMASADNGDDLHERLDALKERAQKHPAIYVRGCVDERGRAMTAEDVERVCRYLDRYVSEDERVIGTCVPHLYRADSCFDSTWLQEYTKQGRRRFLETKSADRCASRVDVINQFVRAVRARVDRCTDKTVPMEPPLQYCGYTSDFNRRDYQHSAYTLSGSWLTGLFMSFTRRLFGSQYEMKALCVCLIGEEASGPISEIVITRLSSAYYHTGGGFSIGLAGDSMASLLMTKLTQEERGKIWSGHQAALKSLTHYESNMKVEKDRIVAYAKKQMDERKKRNLRELDFLRSGLEAIANGVNRDASEYDNTHSHRVWASHENLSRRLSKRKREVEAAVATSKYPPSEKMPSSTLPQWKETSPRLEHTPDL